MKELVRYISLATSAAGIMLVLIALAAVIGWLVDVQDGTLSARDLFLRSADYTIQPHLRVRMCTQSRGLSPFKNTTVSIDAVYSASVFSSAGPCNPRSPNTNPATSEVVTCKYVHCEICPRSDVSKITGAFEPGPCTVCDLKGDFAPCPDLLPMLRKVAPVRGPLPIVY